MTVAVKTVVSGIRSLDRGARVEAPARLRPRRVEEGAGEALLGRDDEGDICGAPGGCGGVVGFGF